LAPNPANPYAYRGGAVPPGGRLPIPDSAAAFGPTQGALLLYKVQIVSLDNRPWKIRISDPANPRESASAELDV
jgi:hypothetical protein